MNYVIQQDLITDPFDLSCLPGALPGTTPCALLDSSLINGDTGRFSIFGAFPFLVLRGYKEYSVITYYAPDQTEVKQEKKEGSPFEIFNALFRQYNTISQPDLPLAGGAIGYFSFELLYMMDEFSDIGEPKKTGIDIPLLYFGFYDTVILEDKVKKEKKIISTGIGPWEGPQARENGQIKIEKYKNLIARRSPETIWPENLKEQIKNCPLPDVDELDTSYYLDSIKKITSAIGRGEIFQACYTYQKKTAFTGNPLHLYRLLRSINAAPYSAYMDWGDFQIVSASPERFFSVSEGNRIEARPIKGTRPRGKTPEEDRQNRYDLEHSIKDRAENVMITDLLRNDIGKNACLGSVTVKELFKIEAYATVFQMVSIVEGKGRIEGPDNLYRYLLGLFPGGSMTGAPKKRALEILHELEPEKRGVYSGALGYLGFNGKADLNIVIRTAVIKDNMAYIGTGGGIVYDSTPEGEYQESCDKVEIILKAITLMSTDLGPLRGLDSH